MEHAERHSVPKVTLMEVLVVAVALGVVAWVVRPQFSQAAHDSRTGAMSADIQAMRAQIERYRVEHGGRYPAAAEFERQMTHPTRADGSPAEAGPREIRFGPYLREIPVNPCTGGNRVSGRSDDRADWAYDQASGRILPLGTRGSVDR